MSGVVSSWDNALQNASNDVSHIIVTANNRLAKFLSDYYLAQISSETTVALPAITPWQSWLTEMATQLVYLGKTNQLPMTKCQQQWLWQQAAKQHKLPVNNSMINQMQAALQLLNHWQLPLESACSLDNPDHQIFHQTALMYLELSRDLYLHDETVSLNILIQHASVLPLPSRISLVGFAELTPLQQALLNQLQSIGCSIEYLTLAIPDQQENYYTYPEPSQEFAAMAAWAFNNSVRNNPFPVLCVVPDLHHQRAEIQYHFDKMKKHHASQAVYSIAGGDALLEYPLIKTMMTSLKLFSQRIDVDVLCEWLQSPYLINTDAENHARLQLIQYIKQYYYRPISNKQFIKLIDNSTCESLKQAVTKIKISNEQRVIEYFNYIIESLLNISQRDLSSLEYQLLQKWQQLLIESKQIVFIHPEITSLELLRWLETQATSTLFQIEDSKNDIQVLGLLEATGMPSQATWVCQMSDKQWPMPAKANPFIPYSLQQQHQFPHASASKQLDYAIKTRQLWQKNWQSIIYSFAQDENNMTRASQLLSDLPNTKLQHVFYNDYVPPATVEKTRHDDTYGLTYQATQASGGAGLLKTQAECPFKAYASYRLNARSLKQPELGINPLEKGNIIHTLLEKFWLTCKSSINLQKMTCDDISDQLTNLYQQHIESTMIQPDVIHQLELTRAVKIATSWLMQEQHRPTFTVAAVEAKCQYTINNMTFNLRLDRIDKLSDDRFLIIDYKTSKQVQTAAKWQTPRLAEPQLPMYSLAYGENCHAIAFITLNAKNQTLRGISDDINLLTGIKAINWENQVNDWLTDIKALVEQFQAGYAAVDPKRTTTCQTCELQSICGVLRDD